MTQPISPYQTLGAPQLVSAQQAAANPATANPSNHGALYDIGQAGGKAGAAAWGFLGDAANSYFGKASYAPGGQFGSNLGADAYGQQLSGLGAAQSQYDTTLGGYNADMMNNRGDVANDTFQNIGNGQNSQFQSLGDSMGSQGPALAGYGGAAAGGLAGQQAAQAAYQGMANGTGPSAAQAQLQSGLDQSIAAQQAAAASTRGGFGLAQAGYNAAQNAGQLEGQAANSAAQLRAQEQQAGIAGLGNISGAIQQQQASNQQFNAQQQQQQQQAAAAAKLQAYGIGASNQLGAYGQGASTNLAYQNAAQQAQLGWTQQGQNLQQTYNQLGLTPMTSQLTADTASQKAQDDQMAGNAERSQKGTGGLLSMFGI